jgi:lipoprotein signal peptidase
MTPRTRLKLVCLAIVVVGTALDLWSKQAMQDLLGMDPHRESERVVEVIPGVLRWSGHWNRGITFGALQGLTEPIRVFTLVASLGIAAWLVLSRNPSRLLHVALSMILAGALGNLHDRLRWGGVRDFVDFYAIRYPAFNLADSMIVVGVGLVLWREIFGRRASRGAESPA